MSLVTRCPRCRTLFRVTPTQLQARSGQVRCGRCMNAFDAYAALAAEAGNVLPAPPVAAPDSPEAAPPPPPRAEPPTANPQNTTAAASLKTPVAATATTNAGTLRDPVIPSAGASVKADVPETAESEPFSARILYKWTPAQAWTAAAAALAILLVLQAVFAYRSEIVARSPSMRGAVNAICERLGCRIALPQRPELVRIEASDVHMVDATRPQLIQLTATLRSYAGFDVAYPALDLVLTNANEHALARRIFRPDEYLDASRDPEAGIPANAEITVALDLDTGDLNAAGFRLDLLAAPAP